MEDRLSHLYASLTALLGQELDLYGEMEQVLKAEKEALLQCRHDQIVANNRWKEELLYRIEVLERSRREMVRQIALYLQAERSSPVDMTFLLAHVPDPLKERLRLCQEEIKTILQRVRSLNGENRRLAETALTYTRGWLAYFHQLATPSAGYHNNGHVQSRTVNGRVISRKG